MRIVLFLLFICFESHANYNDFLFMSSARSYPGIGAEMNFEVGRNIRLWGKVDKKRPFYGFIRPYLRFNSSVVINSGEAGIGIYPVSFLGVEFQHKSINSRFQDFPFFNCETTRCKGMIKRDIIRPRMALGYGPIVAMADIIYAKNYYNDPGKEKEPVAEFRYAMLASAGRDDLYNSQFVLGVKTNATDMVALLVNYAKLSRSGQSNNMDLLLYQTKMTNISYALGAGQFSSTHWAKGFIAVLQMKISFIDSMKLF